MLQPVNVGSKLLADDTHIVGRDLAEEVRALAEPLQGLRVIHLSATAFGGGVSEIPLQVENGVSGYLVRDLESCAARTIDILQDPALGKALGRRGKEHVRTHFLTPRYLRDYLRIIRAGLDEAAAPARVQQIA